MGRLKGQFVAFGENILSVILKRAVFYQLNMRIVVFSSLLGFMSSSTDGREGVLRPPAGRLQSVY